MTRKWDSLPHIFISKRLIRVLVLHIPVTMAVSLMGVILGLKEFNTYQFINLLNTILFF